MRGLVIIAVLFFVSAVFGIDNSCKTVQLTCAASLGNCSQTYTDVAMVISLCPSNQICNYTLDLTDFSYQGTCLSLGAGASCTSGSCNDGYVCWQNACTEIKTVGLDGGCDTANVCQNNMYCNRTSIIESGFCVPASTSGQNCTTSAQCIPGLVCSAESNTCVSGYSLAEGSTCTEAGIECAVGLTCELDSTSSAFHCIKPRTSSLISCNSTSDFTTCPDGEYCTYSSCTSNGTALYTCQNYDEANTQAEKEAYENLAKCQNSNVDNVCNSYSTATCTKCMKEACAVDRYEVKDSCGNGYCDSGSVTTSASTAATTNNDNSSSASSLIASSLFFVLAALYTAL